MSSTPKEKKRKQQDTSGRPSLQDSKKPKKQIRRNQPAESSHSGKTSPAKHIKPEVSNVLLEDPGSSPSTTADSGSTPSSPSGSGGASSSESEHTPEPVEQIVLAAEEAAIIHGPIKTAAIRGTLKEYVLQQSRDREPQPFPIPHQQLSTPHNKNNHRGLLHNEVWRVSPNFNLLAVSSFGRFLLDKKFLGLRGQMSRRHRHSPAIRVTMNEGERRVHNLQRSTRNLYDIDADEQVLLAFGRRQPTPESGYIIHLDGDFWNNSFDNLNWATHAEFYAHHPFDKRILYSRVASMNYNPRIPWQSKVHNTMYLMTSFGEVVSFSKHHVPDGHDEISPVDGLLTKRLEVVDRALDEQITRTMSVAEMVLDTFRGYNPDTPFIIFEDGNRMNAVLENLRAASLNDYSLNFFYFLPRRYGGEVFRSIGNISTRRGDFDLSRYWVSDVTGKIYSEFSNSLLTYDSQVPYSSIPLTPQNSQDAVFFPVHHLVHNAHIRRNLPQYEIDHVYGDTLDVSAANLRMVSHVANVKLAYALDCGKDLLDVTEDQLLSGNFNIDDMRDAPPGQVARINQVHFPTWSSEDIAREIENGIWSPIIINSEYTGYDVSTRGMVKRKNAHQIVHSTISHGGYVYVNLYIEGQRIRRALHTVIARAFINNDDPNNKNIVDHINGSRTDFSIENLEWISYQESAVRATGVGIDVYNEENDMVATFSSLGDCAAQFDFDGYRYSELGLENIRRRGEVLHGGYYLVRK